MGQIVLMSFPSFSSLKKLKNVFILPVAGIENSFKKMKQ